MLQFKETCILTGIEKRLNKDKTKEYILINFLGETGQTFGCMYVGEIVPSGFNQLDKVAVDFKVVPGRYTQLQVLNMVKVDK